MIVDSGSLNLLERCEDQHLLTLLDAVGAMKLPDPSTIAFHDETIAEPCKPLSEFPELKDINSTVLSGFAVKIEAITEKFQATISLQSNSY